MDERPMITLVILALLACSGRGEPNPHTAAAAVAPERDAAPTARAEPELPPASALREADRLYLSQLGASRGQFEVERQVAELRQAKLLYEQFLEHAADRPELAPAVRKSRERIIDVQQTIDFLEASSRANGEAPAAPQR